ncbi:hypothetical protein Goari_007417, partial [Gossypium aridum]|nr:hypothetical protein [Gossypium aridum]
MCLLAQPWLVSGVAPIAISMPMVGVIAKPVTVVDSLSAKVGVSLQTPWLNIHLINLETGI